MLLGFDSYRHKLINNKVNNFGIQHTSEPGYKYLIIYFIILF